MVVTLFRIAPGKTVEFQAIYGDDRRSVWSKFCRKSAAYLGGSLRRMAGSDTFYERLELWRSHEDWKYFRESNRAERKRIAGFAEGIVLSERIVDMYYESRSRPDDDQMLSPA